MKNLSLLTALLLASSAAAIAQTASVDAPTGTTLLLKAKGDGVQIYSCTQSHWTLKAPDARLLDPQGNVIGKHFAGPTWQLTNGGEVKGKPIANQPSPDATAVPWLLLQAISSKGSLAQVTYIRRTETEGGVPPQATCTGGQLEVPYTATYEFYTGGK